MASSSRSAALALALALAPSACGSKAAQEAPPPTPPPGDAVRVDAVAATDAVWPELAEYPSTAPVRTIPLATKAGTPRFEVGGPALLGDLAVVASSQTGFVAVDWRRGQVMWTKPSGPHVAPPLATPDGFVLVSDCFSAPRIPAGESLLGCARIVTPQGADQAYFAIHAPSNQTQKFRAEMGRQSLWPDGDHRVRWRRGDEALSIDTYTGVASPASAAPTPLAFTYKSRVWTVSHLDGKLVGTGPTPWKTERTYSALIGLVWTADGAPLVRVMNAGAYMGAPELTLFDIDATGSMHAQVARPLPGIQVLASATSSIGDAAIAARLDTSLERDIVAGYAANALLMWVYPLPRMPRPDPVGIAVAPSTPSADGAVVVFHDGDTVTVLPDLSAPPTAPGAAKAPSEIPTP